jgi:hypothetical protein
MTLLQHCESEALITDLSGSPMTLPVIRRETAAPSPAPAIVAMTKSLHLPLRA